VSPATSILLIEPDSSSAAYMQAALRRAGYDVTTASNGKEGLIVAWRDQPDMFLTELDLPDFPGQSSSAACGRCPHGAQVPGGADRTATPPPCTTPAPA
jgi:DNA-binding response OmpR family regulator